MKLFIDSANKDIIKKYADLNIFTGITSTPTFFRREGISDVAGEIKKICEIFPGEVHLEAIGNTSAEIIKNAEDNFNIDPNIVSKIPMSHEGIKAVQYLSQKGIKTNVHLIFSVNQALMAALAGATYVCPLIGRLYDVGHDGLELVEDILNVFGNYSEIYSEVMVSSVRTPEHVKQAALIGADVTTIPPYVIELMFKHPLTKIGVETFEKDILLTKCVRDVMHVGPEVPQVKEDAGLKEAIVEMTQKTLGLTTVVDKDGKLVGCITDGDLRRIIQNVPNIFECKVKDVMSKAPKTISKDVFLSEALDKMEKFKITNLVITNGNDEPFGIIHIHDIV